MTMQLYADITRSYLDISKEDRSEPRSPKSHKVSSVVVDEYMKKLLSKLYDIESDLLEIKRGSGSNVDLGPVIDSLSSLTKSMDELFSRLDDLDLRLNKLNDLKKQVSKLDEKIEKLTEKVESFKRSASAPSPVPKLQPKRTATSPKPVLDNAIVGGDEL